MESRIQSQAAADADIILDIQADLVADLLGVALHVNGGIQLDDTVHRLPGIGGKRFRDEVVVGIICSEPDRLGRRRRIIEIDLRHPVAHAGPIVELIPVVCEAPVQAGLLRNQVRLYLHFIAVVSHRRIRKKFGAHHMVPT